MKKINILAILVFLTGGAFAQTWGLDKNHAKLGFTITHMAVSEVDGQFKTFDATLTSTKADLSDAVFTATADVGSISTDNERRDGHLKSPDFFDAAKFPGLTFKSTSFTKQADGKYKLAGDLTLHGVTKPLTLDVTMKGPVMGMGKTPKPIVGFKFTGKINRIDFGVGSKSPAVGDEVWLNGNAEFGQQ
jgi:polyisoprenoid-binding protein YceI